MFGLFDKKQSYRKLYLEECRKNKKLENEMDEIKTELDFLRICFSNNTHNVNNEYERARAFLINCFNIQSKYRTNIVVDMTGLFEVFGIPFYRLCPQYEKDGTRLYSKLACYLDIEDPNPVLSSEEVDVKNCIDWDLLNSLLKSEGATNE